MILSNQYAGLFEEREGNYPDILITKWEYGKDTKIVLNEVDDDCMIERDHGSVRDAIMDYYNSLEE